VQANILRIQVQHFHLLAFLLFIDFSHIDARFAKFYDLVILIEKVSKKDKENEYRDETK